MKLPGHRIAAIALAMVVMLIDASAGLAQSSGRPIVATTPHFSFYSDFPPTSVTRSLPPAARGMESCGRLLCRDRLARPVFHEASHFLTGRNTPLRAALDAAARNAGGGSTPPSDLIHSVHFFMTGEAVRRVLEKPGEPPYTSYLEAHRLSSDDVRDAIKKTWPAYMDGKRALRDSAADLLRALH